jgi:hypothetical protein
MKSSADRSPPDPIRVDSPIIDNKTAVPRRTVQFSGCRTGERHLVFDVPSTDLPMSRYRSALPLVRVVGGRVRR